MGTQRHVIKRQTVEITLATKENAWQLQQELSRIFQQHLPSLLDRCLSEAGSPDYLHRIDRLELDLGELDSNRLEAELLEKIDATLRQALSEQIGDAPSLPVAGQTSEPMLAHVELFEHFVREGYLPWWADSSQRQLPEKSFTVLLNSAPDTLKCLLPRLIREPRCLQRLIGYFDDNYLVAMTALLTAVPKNSAASLLQTLSAVQAPLHQRSRMPMPRLRATLWQSLLQVVVAGEPVISRYDEFLTAVIVRWAKLQGLPEQTLVGCLQQLLPSLAETNNEWLQTISLLAPADHTSTEFAEEAVGETQQPGLTDASPIVAPVVFPDSSASAAIGNREAVFDTLHPTPPKPTDESLLASQITDTISIKDATHDKPRPVEPKLMDESAIASQTRVADPISVSSTVSNRSGMPKKTRSADSEQAQKTMNKPLAGDIATEQPLLDRPPKNNSASDEQARTETTNDGSVFSDTDALYINNAGLCILWPFLVSFFERLELVQNGHFHDRVAKQCAVSLLHYLATAELKPPEYLLPFNKLLCALDIDEVFDLAAPLTAEQIAACDELLGTVIDNAPILNNMSVNGFRGSFLLRQGSLSVSAGSWLLRVERETYDVVLERFPWSWQWIKLPWMEHPLRVEW